MRLAGLGVLALLLVGFLIFLGQRGAFDANWLRSEGPDPARFYDANTTVLAHLDAEGSEVFGAPVAQDAPLILSGLPAYAGMQFRLPLDTRPVSGDLDLVFTTLVAENVEGVLRVSINGMKRAEYLLETGQQAHSLQVQLTREELASGTINAAVSLQGRGPIAECTGDDAIAAVVTLDPASGLRLNLSGAPQTTRDKLALWGDRVPMALTGGADGAGGASSDDTNALHQAAILREKGYRPVLAENGVVLEILRTLAGEASPRDRFTVPAAYPIALASAPVNDGVRKFTRRTSWRYTYDAADLPDGRLPSALDLRLLIGPSTTRLQRDVAVTLNNNLLFSRRIADGAERLNQSVVIPARVQKHTNTLDITVSAYDAQDLRCGDIAQSVAQLLPGTALRAGTARLDGELEGLRAALLRAGSVRLDTGALSPPDATAAITLIAALGPSRWEASQTALSARIRAFANGAAAQRMTREPEMDHWIVTRPAPAGSEVTVQRLGQSRLEDIAATALVVSVVRPPAQASTRASGL